MVNHFMAGAASQAQAVVAAEGATVSVATVVKEIENHETKVGDQKDMMRQLLAAGGQKEASMQNMKDLLTKVANAGIMFDGIAPQPKAENKPEKSKNSSHSEQGEFSDLISLSGEKGKNESLPIGAMTQSKQRSGRQNVDKWEALKTKLIEEGKSAQEISIIEQQFKTSESQKTLMSLLKDSAIMYYLDSDTKLTGLIRKRGFGELLKKAGKELGKQAALEAQAEVKSFVYDELENQLIARTFLQDNDFANCHRLMKVGEKVGMTPTEWIDNVWPEKKENHGLYLLDAPNSVANFVDLKDNDPNRRQKSQYEYKEEDEKDLLLNRMRAAYMQLALRPGAISSVETWFKVRKLKGGLLRLGIYTRDLDEKVQAEAKTLAKVKTMEMLEEALQERASFFDEGSAKELVNNRVKNVLKNLERLGFELKEDDFVALRDKANRDMYNLAQRELESTKSNMGPIAGEKIEMLNKLISKLQAETNLGLREEA